MPKARLDIPLGKVPGLPDEKLHIAADIIWPDALSADPAVLICLPGGGVHRQYFDMRPGGDASYSFAIAMAASGHITVQIDHLGVGESAHPADGFALTAAVLAAANAQATDAILACLFAGTAATGLPAFRRVLPVGVGHSMGGMLVTLQQHEYGSFPALAVLCFHTGGLPQYLTQTELDNLRRPNLGRDAYPALAASRFGGDPYQPVQRARGGSLASDAVADVQAGVLATAAFQSMMPGNITPEAAALNLPLFLAAGDRDMMPDPHAIPEAFPGCTDIETVIVPASGHHPFVSPNRALLFKQLGAWMTRQRATLPEAAWRS